jgi:hypothetical protein
VRPTPIEPHDSIVKTRSAVADPVARGDPSRQDGKHQRPTSGNFYATARRHNPMRLNQRH